MRAMDPITRLELLGPGADLSSLDEEPTAEDLAALEDEFVAVTRDAGMAGEATPVLPPRPDDTALAAALAERLPGLGAFFTRGTR